jgi:hypothetical protein
MLDFATGYELQFFVFYFAPIALVAWNMRLSWGLFMAFACAGTWFAVDRLSGHTYSSYFYPHWNTAIRLASFLTIAYTINKVQRVLIKERLLNAELTQALVQVKQLSGLLPICASCKSIRNDEGYWEQIESYVGTHSDAEFSHGICPDCMKKLYPEYCDKKGAVEE